MAIEQIENGDSFDKYEGYYLRKTYINSYAEIIPLPGSFPMEIARLDEEHYQIFYKKAYGESEFYESYPTYKEALEVLIELSKEEPESE